MNTNNLDKKTMRDRLRIKVNNLCKYMHKQFPDKNLRITELANYKEEEIILYIIQNLVPGSDNLEKLVAQLCMTEGISPSKDVKDKLIRYCDYFCQFVK